MRSYGLILPGGGAKGAYQIGAWSALREMRIKFSAIAGVSIGSINGALIASNRYEQALEMWNTVRIEHGVNITEELKEPDNLFSVNNYAALFKEIMRNGGIDASPTKDFLSQYIDEAAVRKSKIPLGLITYYEVTVADRSMHGRNLYSSVSGHTADNCSAGQAKSKSPAGALDVLGSPPVTWHH